MKSFLTMLSTFIRGQSKQDIPELTNMLKNSPAFNKACHQIHHAKENTLRNLDEQLLGK